LKTEAGGPIEPISLRPALATQQDSISEQNKKQNRAGGKSQVVEHTRPWVQIPVLAKKKKIKLEAKWKS
jgi:hypothetical protein